MGVSWGFFLVGGVVFGIFFFVFGMFIGSLLSKNDPIPDSSFRDIFRDALSGLDTSGVNLSISLYKLSGDDGDVDGDEVITPIIPDEEAWKYN